MQKKKLRKFILISVAFHIVLISAILFYFYKHPLMGGKSGTVMVGVISSKDIGQGDSSELSKAAKNESTTEEVTKPKLVSKKEPTKQNIQNQKEIKKEKQASTIVAKTVETKSVTNPKEVSSSNIKAENKQDKGIEAASLSNSGKPNAGQDQASGTTGTNTELAYPDYNVNPKPKYPRAARKRGYEGEVKLKVLVLDDGKVGKIEVIRPSGYEILDDSALEAVRNWIFIPGKANGKEISSWVTVPITFQLKSG
ncbi:MAG: energy transducer TonB [Thermodesulfobacteriota bacterium]